VVIPRVWENTEGMLGNLNPLGDGPGRSLADHGARVPEVLPAAELEGFLAGLIIAMPQEFLLTPDKINSKTRSESDCFFRCSKI
jgi:hypothetical protein